MKNKPLPDQLRPETLDEIVGQEHILCKDSLIRMMVKNHQLYSLIFYGPPGTGKTTLALALCNELAVPHCVFNAVIDSKAQLVNIIETAKQSVNGYVIIVEEIHRLNKDKQDILLPYIEKGIVYIFACTTENPYFIVNPAIRSRCQILELKPISSDEMFKSLKKLIRQHGLGLQISYKYLKKICNATNGDYRSVMNIIDLLVNLYLHYEINDSILDQVLQNNHVSASHYWDDYYYVLSALHKSLRGSDPDAAIYYLARLLVAGDFISLNRRLIACAYEDIGLANPQLCARVVTAVDAATMVGWPENKQIYADIVIEMALSPKSNSGILAIMSALDDVQSGKAYPIPQHIRDQSYKSAAKLDRKGYKYPHDFNGYVNQQYLPNALVNKKYYHKKIQGLEDKLNSWLELMKKTTRKE